MGRGDERDARGMHRDPEHVEAGGRQAQRDVAVTELEHLAGDESAIEEIQLHGDPRRTERDSIQDERLQLHPDGRRRRRDRQLVGPLREEVEIWPHVDGFVDTVGRRQVQRAGRVDRWRRSGVSRARARARIHRPGRQRARAVGPHDVLVAPRGNMLVPVAVRAPGIEVDLVADHPGDRDSDRSVVAPRHSIQRSGPIVRVHGGAIAWVRHGVLFLPVPVEVDIRQVAARDLVAGRVFQASIARGASSPVQAERQAARRETDRSARRHERQSLPSTAGLARALRAFQARNTQREPFSTISLDGAPSASNQGVTAHAQAVRAAAGADPGLRTGEHRQCRASAPV